LVGDGSPQIRSVAEFYKRALPEGWAIHLVTVRGLPEDEGQNYKPKAQNIIATLRAEAFTAARKVGADQCWSLDSDTLPPPNALRCMQTMLSFDDGWYSVSTCPYPNDLFLGGRGSLEHHIAPNVYPDEREVPARLRAALAACKDRLHKAPSQREADRMGRLQKRVEGCPPKGNVFTLNAAGYRKRGWLEFAYPGVGVGAVVPSDWCGFGCTLLNKKALELAHFEGYDGQGTEDLFIVWRRWAPAGLRINCVTHCPCDHVIWSKKKGGRDDEFTLISSYHESSGECVGHLRTRRSPWQPETPGEE
jgi:hypothetical protein